MNEAAADFRILPESYRAATRRHRSRSWFPLLGLGGFMVASIFYIFPSGLPQPADGALAGAMLVSFLLVWHYLPTARALYLTLALWCSWVILVNLAWFCIRAYQVTDLDWAFPRKTSFYLFNACVLTFVVAVGFHDWSSTRKVVRWACLLGLFAQAVYLWFNPPVVDESGLRSVGTFNNPNQLGYWALLIMACLAVVKERGSLKLLDLAGLGCGMYALMMSLSKAASISGLILIVMILLFCGIGRRSITVLAGLAALAVAGALLADVPIAERIASLDPVAKLEQRLSTIGSQTDDSPLQRGYVRFLLWPEYLVFGAGEGAFERFKAEHTSNEFHSTLGNVFFSYGIIGFGLFLVLLWAVFERAPWTSWMYFGPVMLYGLTHMGLRFSEFWIFLGLVYAQSRFGGAPRRPLRAIHQGPHGLLKARAEKP